MKRDDLREVIARAICRVQLNGGDPDQPAVRWNGTEMEPQSFPAWRDYLDEARHSLSAIEAAGMRIVPSETFPILHGNGVEDDTAALQAMVEGKPYVDETK